MMPIRLIAGLFLISILSASCVRTAFTPIWFGPSPNQTYDIQDKKDLHAALSYCDADNGTGVSAHTVYSPLKHLMVGGGVSNTSNKGLVYTTSELAARSSQFQYELLGGTYWNTKRKFLSAQAYVGVGQSFSNAFLQGNKVLNMRYQKISIQPALIVRLPNSMFFDFSYRLSQIYFTNVTVKLGTLTNQYLETIRAIQRESPFRMGELGIGYTYQTGPFQTHIQYSVVSPFQTNGLQNFDQQVISTSIRVNIHELHRLAKKDTPKE
jgi:hypothetical protein